MLKMASVLVKGTVGLSQGKGEKQPHQIREGI